MTHLMLVLTMLLGAPQFQFFQGPLPPRQKPVCGSTIALEQATMPASDVQAGTVNFVFTRINVTAVNCDLSVGGDVNIYSTFKESASALLNVKIYDGSTVIGFGQLVPGRPGQMPAVGKINIANMVIPKNSSMSFSLAADIAEKAAPGTKLNLGIGPSSFGQTIGATMTVVPPVLSSSNVGWLAITANTEQANTGSPVEFYITSLSAQPGPLTLWINGSVEQSIILPDGIPAGKTITVPAGIGSSSPVYIKAVLARENETVAVGSAAVYSSKFPHPYGGLDISFNGADLRVGMLYPDPMRTYHVVLVRDGSFLMEIPTVNICRASDTSTGNCVYMEFQYWNSGVYAVKLPRGKYTVAVIGQRSDTSDSVITEGLGVNALDLRQDTTFRLPF